MKLVIATDNYLPRWDGIARFLSEIVPRLAKEYEVIVIAPDFGDAPEIKNVTVVKIPLSKFKGGDFKIAKFKYKIIKDIIAKSDAVFSQTIGPIGICAILASKAKFKPLITFTHSIEWELFPKAMVRPILKKFAYPLTKRVVRFLYNKARLLIVPSDNIADMLSWEKITTKKKIVHLGVNTKKFSKSNKQDAKKKLGLKAKDFVIGYHGRLGREKDLKTLLRAFIRVRSKYDNVKLLIVGDGAPDVKKIFQNQTDVIYHEAKNNVVPYIHAMDIYVIPSLTETTSLSTLEAMSCETAVIATRVGHIKDYIIDGENGLFFQKQDTFDLVRKIRILYEDSALRNKLGSNARKTVLEQFLWSTAAEKIIRGIKSAIEKK